MTSSKPLGLRAALALALCLAAPAAFADSGQGGWLSNIFESPSKAAPNTDARYPTTRKDTVQGAGSDVQSHADTRYAAPTEGVPQYSTNPPARNSDSRYPESQQGL
jgi:hypothetical protein